MIVNVGEERVDAFIISQVAFFRKDTEVSSRRVGELILLFYLDRDGKGKAVEVGGLGYYVFSQLFHYSIGIRYSFTHGHSSLKVRHSCGVSGQAAQPVLSIFCRPWAHFHSLLGLPFISYFYIYIVSIHKNDMQTEIATKFWCERNKDNKLNSILTKSGICLVNHFSKVY